MMTFDLSKISRVISNSFLELILQGLLRLQLLFLLQIVRPSIPHLLKQFWVIQIVDQDVIAYEGEGHTHSRPQPYAKQTPLRLKR